MTGSLLQFKIQTRQVTPLTSSCSDLATATTRKLKASSTVSIQRKRDSSMCVHTLVDLSGLWRTTSLSCPPGPHIDGYPQSWFGVSAGPLLISLHRAQHTHSQSTTCSRAQVGIAAPCCECSERGEGEDGVPELFVDNLLVLIGSNSGAWSIGCCGVRWAFAENITARCLWELGSSSSSLGRTVRTKLFGWAENEQRAATASLVLSFQERSRGACCSCRRGERCSLMRGMDNPRQHHGQPTADEVDRVSSYHSSSSCVRGDA